MTKKKFWKWVEDNNGNLITKRGRFNLVEYKNEGSIKGRVKKEDETKEMEKKIFMNVLLWAIVIGVVGGLTVLVLEYFFK